MSDTAPLSTSSRNWAMAAHLSGALSIVVLPTLGWVGPLVVWAFQRDEPEVVVHVKKALAFQLAIFVLSYTVGALAALLSWVCLGWLLLPVAALLWGAGVVGPLIAAVRVNNGQDPGYPLLPGP